MEEKNKADIFVYYLNAKPFVSFENKFGFNNNNAISELISSLGMEERRKCL